MNAVHPGGRRRCERGVRDENGATGDDEPVQNDCESADGHPEKVAVDMERRVDFDDDAWIVCSNSGSTRDKEPICNPTYSARSNSSWAGILIHWPFPSP
jgi:hypothetical protein